jgi:outer membrane protein TolC
VKSFALQGRRKLLRAVDSEVIALHAREDSFAALGPRRRATWSASEQKLIEPGGSEVCLAVEGRFFGCYGK